MFEMFSCVNSTAKAKSIELRNRRLHSSKRPVGATNSCPDKISSLLSQRSVKNTLSIKSKMLLQYPEWTASLVVF